MCDYCDDTGYVTETCGACSGSGEGRYDGSTCGFCKGSGETTEECTECEELFCSDCIHWNCDACYSNQMCIEMSEYEERN